MTGTTQVIESGSKRAGSTGAKKDLQETSLIPINKGLPPEIWIEILRNLTLKDFNHFVQLNKWFYQLLSGVNYRYSHVNDITILPRSQLHQALLTSNLDAQFTQGELWRYLLQNCEKISVPEFFEAAKTTTPEESYFDTKKINITHTDYHRTDDFREFFLNYLKNNFDMNFKYTRQDIEADEHTLALSPQDIFWESDFISQRFLFLQAIYKNSASLNTNLITQTYLYRMSPYAIEYLGAKLLWEAQCIAKAFSDSSRESFTPKITWKEINDLSLITTPNNSSQILRFLITCRNFESLLFTFFVFKDFRNVFLNNKFYGVHKIPHLLPSWRNGLTSFGLLAADSQGHLILKAILDRYSQLNNQQPFEMDLTSEGILNEKKELEAINNFLEMIELDDFEYYLLDDADGMSVPPFITGMKDLENYSKENTKRYIYLALVYKQPAIIKLLAELYLLKGKSPIVKDTYIELYSLISELVDNPQLLTNVLLKKETLLDALLIDSEQKLSEHFKGKVSVQYTREELVYHLKKLEELRKALQEKHWEQIQQRYYWRRILPKQETAIDNANNKEARAGSIIDLKLLQGRSNNSSTDSMDPKTNSSSSDKERDRVANAQSMQVIMHGLGGSGVVHLAQGLVRQQEQPKQVEINVHAPKTTSLPAYIGYAALILIGLLLLGTGIGGLVHLSFIMTALIFIAGKSLVSGLSIGSLITGGVLLLGTGFKLALDFCRPSAKQHIEPAPGLQPLPQFLAEQGGKEKDVGSGVVYQDVIQPSVPQSLGVSAQPVIEPSAPKLVVTN